MKNPLVGLPQHVLVQYVQNPKPGDPPQFMALDAIKQQQEIRNSANMAPQGTVADDILHQAVAPQMQPQMPQQMAQQRPPVAPPQGVASIQQPNPQQMAQQLPENQPGVSQLPSGMPRGMAAGGIVAFARGGLNLSLEDEESTETEDEELARLFPVDDSRMRYLSSYIPESVQAGVQALMAKMPQSYEAAKKDRTGEPAPQDKEGIQGLLHKVGHLESRNQDYDKFGRLLTSPKGAEGRMQTLRSTQRDPGYGVTPAKDSSVEEKNRVGEDYFKAMLSKFKDPKLAAMAYNWGPGNVQKWLESDKKMPIPQETRQYASNFAKGGAIPRFAGEGPSLVGPSGEPMEDFLEKNPAEPKPEKTLTEPEKARARDIAKTEEALRKNAARAAEMKAPKTAPITSSLKPPPANFAESSAGKINKLIGATLLPYGVLEGGKYATEGAMSQIARPEMSATREALMHDVGGDQAFASGIMQNADYSKPDSQWSKALRNNPISNYLFGTSGDSPVAPQPKAPVAAPTAAPAAPSVENPFAPAAPATPAQQSAQDKYFELASKQIEDAAANLAKQGKMNAALSVLNAGLGMMKSKSPYLLGGIGEGGQEGVSTFASLNKQQNEGLKDLMAARLGLAKTGASAGYANEMLGLRRVDIARDNLQRYVDKRMAEVLAMPGGAMNKDYATARAAIFKDPVYIQLARDAQVPYNEAAAPGPAGPRKEPLGAFQK
jgi:hypothetical protein